MTDNELLAKIERGEIGISIHIGTWADDMRDINGQLRKMADIKAELLRLAKIGAERQWVACSERLPEVGQLVFVSNGSWVNLRYLFIDNGNPYWFDISEENEELSEYTHWQPLPPLPGGEG